MPSFFHLKVGTRLRLIVLIAFGLFAVVMWQSLSSLGQVMLDERKSSTRHAVESAHGVLEHFQRRELAGEMTRDEAQAAAMAVVKNMRYGDGEYFIILDMHPRMLMHPVKPELDGMDQREFADPNGKRMSVEFVEVVKKSGAGYVDYVWQKAGRSDPQPKVTYVQGFAPWGWMIGSGVYVNDVDETFWQHTRYTFALGALAALLVILLSWRIGRGILRQLGGEPSELQQVAGQIAERDLTSHVKVAAGDTRSITYAMEQMQSRLAEVIRRVRDNARDVTVAGRSRLRVPGKGVLSVKNLKNRAVKVVVKKTVQARVENVSSGGKATEVSSSYAYDNPTTTVVWEKELKPGELWALGYDFFKLQN